MEKAIQLDPDNLDAREGLFQYYTQAPFFVGGSASKAAAQLEEIRRRDVDRGTALGKILDVLLRATIELHPAQAEPRQPRDRPGERHRRLGRRYAGAANARIDVDDHIERRAGLVQRAVDPRRDVVIVDGRHQPSRSPSAGFG